MARTARVVMDNTAYHVITRGNQKQNVFRDQADYQEFIKLLQKYKKLYDFKLYGFCLMPNHVHILLEISKGRLLSRLMSGLSLSYTIYFNYKYKAVGHLWQGRYKSKVIVKDSYLLECINYINNNPVRASLVDKARDYPWASENIKGIIDGLVENIFSP
jgi:putative transposase